MHIIDKIIKDGYVIDSQKLMNSIFETYKKTAMLIMLILLCFFGITLIISTIGVMMYYSNPVEAVKNLNNWNPNDLNQQQWLIYQGFNVLISSIFGVLLAGMLNFIRYNKATNANAIEPLLSIIFSLKGIKVFLFQIVFQVISQIILYFGQMLDMIMVLMFLNILLYSLNIFVIPFIIFDNLSIFKAIQYSIQCVNQQPIKILSLSFFYVTISFFGIFFFMIGLLFSLPILFCYQYNIYASLKGEL